MRNPFIIAHRGVWTQHTEQNTLPAIQRAMELGYGIETDLRSHPEGPVLSHDPLASGQSLLPLTSLLDLAQGKTGITLFLNIKEDGLANQLRDLLAQDDAIDYVFFDMSVPELVSFAKHFPAKRMATRISDLEPKPYCSSSCSWFWIDCFQRELEAAEIDAIIKEFPGKRLAFVSPELHGRAPQAFWTTLKRFAERGQAFALCTDLIEQAKDYFL